jgi:hypothetical protein
LVLWGSRGTVAYSQAVMALPIARRSQPGGGYRCRSGISTSKISGGLGGHPGRAVGFFGWVAASGDGAFLTDDDDWRGELESDLDLELQIHIAGHLAPADTPVVHGRLV